MANVVLQCNDSAEFCSSTARLLNRLNAVKEEKNRFNAQLMDAGSGKIGAANERMLTDIVEVGGQKMDVALDAMIEAVGGNILEAGFSAHLAQYGCHHQYDPKQD